MLALYDINDVTNGLIPYKRIHITWQKRSRITWWCNVFPGWKWFGHDRCRFFNSFALSRFSFFSLFSVSCVCPKISLKPNVPKIL